jgi:glutathionylspermidine synthase
MLSGAAAFVNPFGSVLPQNKRSMAFMWEHMESFSAASKAVIERYIPFTSRLESMHASELRAEPHEWVLKADYGAEGNEVVVGRSVSKEVWLESLARARPGRWVAQRYFDAEPNAHGELTNYGIYLIAGQAAGIYVRTQAGATDDHALSVPVVLATT